MRRAFLVAHLSGQTGARVGFAESRDPRRAAERAVSGVDLDGPHRVDG